MKILSLELSSGQGSLAFLSKNAVCFSREFANDRKHSGLFFENLKICLEQCESPERIVVGLGPGSYAGTRIAIATALGLQAVTNAELLGLPSFCALPTDDHEYLAIGDARRQSFWFARIRDRQCIEGPTLFAEPAELKRNNLPLFTTETLPEIFHATLVAPSALLLAQLVASQSEQLVRAPLQPLYLRGPHITRPKAA